MTVSWRSMPFVRIVILFAAGIIDQLYLNFSLRVILYGFLICISFVLFFNRLEFTTRFRLRSIQNLLFSAIIFLTGFLVTNCNDLSNRKDCITNFSKDCPMLYVTINEPLIQKNKSWKTIATVDWVEEKDSIYSTTGNIILYLQKDSNLYDIHPGSHLVFKKQLQPILNSNDPAGFDFISYCRFRNIYYTVFLNKNEYIDYDGKENFFSSLIGSIQHGINKILKESIRKKEETGFAEAMLIGYKDELDKDLIKAYSNTGVVHIIAISGLHLGIIYWLLLLIFKPLQALKKTKWVAPILILSGLWAFAFLTGAGPSILRSALMFSCLITGNLISKKSNIYNNLAASAFILLCMNPFWLWDIGFQLSYAAVLSIAIFFRPVYTLFNFSNKIVDYVWKMNAVTIAAQILTLPLIIFHFHQLPVYSLLANLVAIPLSTIILLVEIFICTIAFAPVLAQKSASLLIFLIDTLNEYVERINSLPFSVWPNLNISIAQVIILFTLIASVSYWLIGKQKRGLFYALLCLLLFFSAFVMNFH